MNEFLYVEFVFNGSIECDELTEKLEKLGADFNYISDSFSEEWHQSDSHTISGKIRAEAATVIKLTDKFLADRMRISYISATLKDKYRNR